MPDGILSLSDEPFWYAAPAATSTAYQWYRCGAEAVASQSSCVVIAGQTGKSYVLMQEDLGYRIAITVSGTNSAGTNTYWYSWANVIGPWWNTLPTISGTTVVGQVLRTTNGNFKSYIRVLSGQQWWRCATQISSGFGSVPDFRCLSIGNGATYTIVNADVGYYLVYGIRAGSTGGNYYYPTLWADSTTIVTVTP
jgi:hypothetical protein